MRVRTRPAGRAGFTLVELMIVITIIAVLASLLLGAINKVREVAKRTTAVAEISQLDTAIAKFKQDFGFNPPNYIKFPQTNNPTDADEIRALALLRSMFRGYAPVPNAPAEVKNLNFPFLDRDLRGQPLVGSQCLVYFLGGPQHQGFKVTSPDDPGNSNSKKGPYFEIAPGRITRNDAPGEEPEYKYYLRDAWGTPYAYFSTVSSEKYDMTPPPASPVPPLPALSASVWYIPGTNSEIMQPFYTGSNTAQRFINPGRVQIISAGSNQKFGRNASPGASPSAPNRFPFVPGQDAFSVPQPQEGPGFADASAGADDIANFNGGAPLSVSGK